MNIIDQRILSQANVFSYKPVLWLRLHLGEAADTPSSAVADFTDRLLALLPGLEAHKCSLGRRGGFVERLREGTYMAHIFEHVTLELQNACGDDVAYGKARAAKEPAVYDVVVAYRNVAVAARCARLAETLLNALLEGRPIAIGEELAGIRRLREESALGPSAAAVYAAALARGIPAERFADGDLLLLGQGKYRRRVWSTVTDRTSLVAADLVGDKFLTTRLLAECGIPVPRNAIVRTAEEAAAALRRFGGGIVIKPLDGSHGRGVTVDVRTEREAERAFLAAAQVGERVLAEEYIAGRQYRICVVAGKMAAAAERIPAYVIGDGQHTVAELVELTNRNPLRGAGHDKPLTRISIDAAALAVLAKQELTPRLVPEAKRVVQIKETANLSTGGTAVDVTAIVHPENARLAEYAAKAAGLDIAGLDIIAADIARPLGEQKGAVIEINAAPGIRMHCHPSAGQPRDVGGAIVASLFPPGCDGRIPVFAITGTNGKTTTTRLIAAILRQAGHTVGMSTTEGVFLNDECLRRGDCSGPLSAKMALSHPEATAAALETARGGIVRAGLGFDRCDVGVVTNISDDHLGQDGIETLEDLAHVKSLVLEVAAPSGAAVVNADDRFALQLAARARAEVVYFSARPDNIVVRRHLGAGGRAVFLRGDEIHLADGAQSRRLLAVGEIPVTLGGRAAHNVENALAAAAAAYAYGVDSAALRRGLMNFSRNAGRLNFFDFEDFRVCVDYGHNLAGYLAVARTARAMEHRRLVGVIAAPGDRRDDAIIALGEAAGRSFDRIYIKEDADRRGRKRGEVAALLKEGALRAGMDAADITTLLSEPAAVTAALTAAAAGDLIVVFFESYGDVLDALKQFRHRENPGELEPLRSVPPLLPDEAAPGSLYSQ